MTSEIQDLKEQMDELKQIISQMETEIEEEKNQREDRER